MIVFQRHCQSFRGVLSWISVSNLYSIQFRAHLLEKLEVIAGSRASWSETGDASGWDEFVVRNKGSIFHLWSWRKVLEGDHSKPFYLVCRDHSDRILAVCPFICVSGRRLQYLDSLPESQMAGPVVGLRHSNMAQIMASLPKSIGFSPFSPIIAMRIRVHQPPIVESLRSLEFQYAQRYGLLLLDLQARTPEHIWSNGFQKHDRQAVKYFDQRGATFGFAESRSEHLEYLALEGDSPENKAAHLDLLSRMRLNLGDRFKVSRVRLDGRTIMGSTLLLDSVTSTLHIMKHLSFRYREQNAPMKAMHSLSTFAFWNVVKWAKENGFRYVDFGSYSRDLDSDPRHISSKLRERFETQFVPSYDFVIPTHGTAFSIARKIHRVL